MSFKTGNSIIDDASIPHCVQVVGNSIQCKEGDCIVKTCYFREREFDYGI